MEKRNVAKDLLNQYHNNNMGGQLTAKELGEILIGLGNRRVAFTLTKYAKEYSWQNDDKFELKEPQTVSFSGMEVSRNEVRIKTVDLTKLIEASNEFEEEQKKDQEDDAKKPKDYPFDEGGDLPF